MTRKILKRTFFSFCVITLAACASGNADNAGLITGSITDERNLGLPDGIVLVMRLEAVTYGLTQARIINEKHIKDPGGFPMAYELDYPLDAIRDDQKYSVTATIYYGNRLLLRSDWVHYVLTDGHGNTADLVVSPAVTEP